MENKKEVTEIVLRFSELSFNEVEAIFKKMTPQMDAFELSHVTEAKITKVINFDESN